MPARGGVLGYGEEMTAFDSFGATASGYQEIQLSHGPGRAALSPLGASLRSYQLDGIDLTEPAAPGQLPAPGGSGLVMAPWANRVAGARWSLNGEEQQLDITEPARGHAIHGLLRNTGYATTSRSDHAVELAARIWPQHGYPFQLLHLVRYSLDPEGWLSVQQELRNESTSPAPAALGAHPYLRLGETPTDGLTLQVPAETVLEVDELLIPYRSLPVSGDTDLRQPVSVRGMQMDQAFTGLSAASDGWVYSTLRAPDGREVSLRQDPQSCPYVQLFITEGLPGRKRAVAIEPMSAPANAFNSGDGLVWVEPGAAFTISWGIAARL